MMRRSFKAIGTHWQIFIDHSSVSDDVWFDVESLLKQFEQRFSRFLPDSEVVQWRRSKAGTYELSLDLANMLGFAQQLKHQTQGLFDPAIGGLLEKAGYNDTYTFSESKDLGDWELPSWSVEGQSLTISGPIIFDLGGFAKGTLIDHICDLLKQRGELYFLVDGGGDLRGTCKQTGESWNTAVEWPGRPGVALCQLSLNHQAIAVSDIFQRRWKNWHHLVNPLRKKPASDVIGCATLASTAELADGMTTCLALLPPYQRVIFANEHQIEFALITKDSQLEYSKGWPGEFFTQPLEKTVHI